MPSDSSIHIKDEDDSNDEAPFYDSINDNKIDAKTKKIKIREMLDELIDSESTDKDEKVRNKRIAKITNLKRGSKSSQKKTEGVLKEKSFQKGYLQRKMREQDEYRKKHMWKEIALTIFENSYVYPFIHFASKYKCFICSQTFQDPSTLKEHSTTGHTIKEIRKSIRNRELKDHLKVDITSIQCKICSETLKDLNSLKIHLHKIHNKRTVDLEIKDNLVPFKLGSLDCQICGETYPKMRLLIVHMNSHFNNYSCEICGAGFICLKHLKTHQKIHKTGNFPCQKCSKEFNTEMKLTVHIKGTHMKKYPNRHCPMCSEKFSSNYQVTKHLRIAHNKSAGLFKCDQCPRQYDLKGTLLAHVRNVHLQQRNFECQVCHARFYSKYCLSRHMVTHTGERNFKCQVCGKAYGRKSHLTTHAKTHDVGTSYEIASQGGFA